jgi:hypothetical protein
VEPVLVLGTRASRDESDTASVTFRHRGGMRFVGSIGKHLQVVTGVGSTIDFWPFVRPSFSPELALRVRLRACEHDFVLCAAQHAVLGARMDFYATRANPADVTFLVGIAAF